MNDILNWFYRIRRGIVDPFFDEIIRYLQFAWTILVKTGLVWSFAIGIPSGLFLVGVLHVLTTGKKPKLHIKFPHRNKEESRVSYPSEILPEWREALKTIGEPINGVILDCDPERIHSFLLRVKPRIQRVD